MEQIISILTDTGLVLLLKLWFIFTFAISRNGNLHAPEAGAQRLVAGAVPAVIGVLVRVIVDDCKSDRQGEGCFLPRKCDLHFCNQRRKYEGISLFGETIKSNIPCRKEAECRQPPHRPIGW